MLAAARIPFIPMQCADVTPRHTDRRIYQEKIDGKRGLAFDDANGDIRMFARSGNDITDECSHIVRALEKMGMMHFILDGEIATADGDFNSLQNAKNTGEKTWFNVFDVLRWTGVDMMRRPLQSRLNVLFDEVPDVKYVTKLPYELDTYDEALAWFKQVYEVEGKEGLIGKPANSPYVPKNETVWTKMKGKLDPFDAKLIGLMSSEKRLFSAAVIADANDNYLCNVGTGFDGAELKHIYDMVLANKGVNNTIIPMPVLKKTFIQCKPLWCMIGGQSFTKNNNGTVSVRSPTWQGFRANPTSRRKS